MIRTYVISFLLLLTSLQGFTCGCGIQSFEDAIKQSDEIIIGRLIELKEVTFNDYGLGETSTNMWSATFEVEKKWKGSSDKFVTIYQTGSSCDFSFDFPSYPYLVYASYGASEHWYITGVSNILYTWLCSRTAGAEIYNGWTDDSWGDDRPLLDEKFPNSIELRSSSASFIIWTIGGLAIVGIFGWMMKRKYTNANPSKKQLPVE